MKNGKLEKDDLEKAALAAMGNLVEEEAPPPELKTKLFARLGLREAEEAPSEVGAAPPVAAGTLTRVKSDDIEWQATPIPGVFRKLLFMDKANDMCTMLVRMDPGTRYPGHIHAGPEEIFVLEGDFSDDTGTLTKGDFQRVENHTRHGRQTTASGCLLLVRSSPRDKLLQSV
jgi:anti-sigma factor ChrR (cupin superfamily)